MKRIALLAVIGLWAMLFTGCGDNATNAVGTVDTLYISSHDTLYINSHDTVIVRSYDTVLVTTHDTVTSYDTVTVYTYDTVKIYYDDSTSMQWTVGPGITPSTPGRSIRVKSLIWGMNLFVAVGYTYQLSYIDSTNRVAVFTSPDGINWTQRMSGTKWYRLHDVAWASNTYVAVGDTGTIITSPDGLTWTDRTSGTLNNLYGVVYGANKFIAYGKDSIIYTSTDGFSWTVDTANRVMTKYGIGYCMGYGNNRFVSAEDSIYISTDGLAWTYTGFFGTDGKVLWADSQFVIAGYATIRTSSDGLTWTCVMVGDISGGIAWGNGKFVVSGDFSNFTSLDGAVWHREQGLGNCFLAYGAGKFVAVAADGSTGCPVYSSPW